MRTDEQKKKKKILSKFTILCWATFIANLCCMWPMGRRLDTPASLEPKYVLQHQGPSDEISFNFKSPVSTTAPGPRVLS